MRNRGLVAANPRVIIIKGLRHFMAFILHEFLSLMLFLVLTILFIFVFFVFFFMRSLHVFCFFLSLL